MAEQVTISAPITQENVIVQIDQVTNDITVLIEDNTDVVQVFVDELRESFETVSQNLKDYPKTLNYTDGVLTSIVFTFAGGSITKTLNYTGGVLTSIVLSGDTPNGIPLTKTLTYSAGVLVGISYS